MKRCITPVKLLAAATTLLAAQHLFAQLPTNVTPGAVEPEREQLPLREDDDDIVSVPSPSERSGLADTGPAIDVTEFILVYDRPELVDADSKQAVQDVLAAYLQEQGYQLTFQGLEDAAILATQRLREAGFLLAKAVLPPQEVEKAVVRMDIYAGVLGEAYAVDQSLYSEKVLTRPFESQLGNAVRQDEVESSLLRIRDLPGMSAVAVFKPGEEIGETALGVKVLEESRVDYSLRVDNHGIQSTGDIRLLGAVQVNNLTGNRDRLLVDAVKTFNSGDLRNARINYEITDPTLVHTLGLGFSETRYDVERGGARHRDIDGDTEIGDLYLRSQWLRSRNNNFATQLGLATKRAEVDILDTSIGVDRLTVGTLGLVYDGVDNRFRALHRATIQFSRGFDDFIGAMDTRGNGDSLGLVPSSTTPGDTAQELSGRFEKVTATYNRLQSVTRNHSILLRTAGQYSNDYLSSLEKMSLGGPYTVRAYPVAEYVNDRAIFASLAWVVNGAVFGDRTVYDEYALGDVLNLYLFADYGWGKNRNANGTVTRREIDGAGVQADFRFPDKDAYIELIAAKPLGGDEAINGDDFQFWFNVGIEL